MKRLTILASLLALAACTPGQQALIGTLVGVPGTVKAGQCAKPLDTRQREWEATGRKVSPLDCDGDGLPDFGQPPTETLNSDTDNESETPL